MVSKTSSTPFPIQLQIIPNQFLFNAFLVCFRYDFSISSSGVHHPVSFSEPLGLLKEDLQTPSKLIFS